MQNSRGQLMMVAPNAPPSMARIQQIVSCAVVFAVLLTGCSTPLFDRTLFDRTGSSGSSSVQIAQPTDQASATSPVASPPLPRDLPEVPDLSSAREEAMAKMLDQLDSVRQMDSDAQKRLLAELREKKTDEWPLLVSQFHASLKYRQQLNKDDSNVAMTEKSADAIERTIQLPAVPQEIVSSKQLPPQNHEDELEPERESSPIEVLDQQVDLVEDTTIKPAPPVQLVSAEIPRPLPPVSESGIDSLNWRQHVETAIDLIESQAGESKAMETPVLQQVQQKLLQLVVGQSDEAMLPISGASPHEQRYWSEQFFALSTLASSDSKLSEDRRAAQAAQHLDVALAHLRDLSTLTVHHLAFCEQVFDFGAYELHEDNRFTINQEVTLYAEVENYSSELTDKGYHTWFASRYEVLDDQGRRIDGGNFPDVEDTCQNRRRDFHIQYALPLPEHAKPGKYKLQLTIEDRLNGREGTNVIEFDLVGGP